MPYKINTSGLVLNNAGNPATIGGRNFRVEGINPPPAGRIINAKIVVPADLVYQDNAYNARADKLLDGLTTTDTDFDPGKGLYQPVQITWDLYDFNAQVRKIRIYDTTFSGWVVGLYLVDMSGVEHRIGQYTGNDYYVWEEFEFDSVGHGPTPFRCKRFIMRVESRDAYGGANFGAEVEIWGDYDPYTEPPLVINNKPLKWMRGTDVYDWDVWENVAGTWFEPSYQALLNLKPQALRFFTDVWRYQTSKDAWVFEPILGGWPQEQMATRLKQDFPGLFNLVCMQGQFDWIKNDWHVPDPNNYFFGTVYNVIHNNGWDTIFINVDQPFGSGDYKQWYMEPNFTPVLPLTVADYSCDSGDGSSIQAAGTQTWFNTRPGTAWVIGDKIKVNAGHRGSLNFPLQYNDNAGRANPTAYYTMGRQAYIYAQRKGNNPAATTPPYTLGQWDSFKVGINTSSVVEILNEPDAAWAGYDDFMRGKDLAVAWSMCYDGNKGQYPDCGVKNADPNFQLSTSGMATVDIDAFMGVLEWTRDHRGFRPDGTVDFPFDILQIHAYSYTGGFSQYGAGVHGGVPVEMGNVLTGIDKYVWYSSKYTGGRIPIMIGEWGWDVNQNSPISAAPIGAWNPEQTRANWGVRALVEYSAHGLDISTQYQWNPTYAEDDYQTAWQTDILFASMALVRIRQNRTVAYVPWGCHFAQMAEWNEFVFDSRISNENPRVLKFVNNQTNKVIYFIWAVETWTNPSQVGSFKPTYTENTGIYSLALPNGTQGNIREFSDSAFTMNTTSTFTVSGGSLSIPYNARPKVIEITGIQTVPTDYQIIGRQRVDSFPITASWDLQPALTWVPTTYDTDSVSTTYPLILFFHGMGEAGTDLTKLLNTGLPQLIANGFNVEADDPVTLQHKKFIVVSPQDPNFSMGVWCQWAKIGLLLDSVMAKYRVDPTRVYVTGLSAGAQGVISAVAGSDVQGQRFAACCPISFTGYNCGQEPGNVPSVGNPWGVKMWTVVGGNDTNINGVNPFQLSLDLINAYNSTSPTPAGERTVHDGTGHDPGTWNSVYDTTIKMLNGDNLYQYFLRNHR